MIMIILTVSSYTLWLTAATLFIGGLLSLVEDRVALTSVVLAKLTEGRSYIKSITKRNENEIISLYADRS